MAYYRDHSRRSYLLEHPQGAVAGAGRSVRQTRRLKFTVNFPVSREAAEETARLAEYRREFRRRY
jgi:hypothetical protein